MFSKWYAIDWFLHGEWFPLESEQISVLMSSRPDVHFEKSIVYDQAYLESTCSGEMESSYLIYFVHYVRRSIPIQQIDYIESDPTICINFNVLQ